MIISTIKQILTILITACWCDHLIYVTAPKFWIFLLQLPTATDTTERYDHVNELMNSKNYPKNSVTQQAEYSSKINCREVNTINQLSETCAVYPREINLIWFECLSYENTINNMTVVVVGAKNRKPGHCPKRKKRLHDDALISLFSPIHEIFRVFCDAKKKCKNFTGFPQSHANWNEFTWLVFVSLFLDEEEERKINFH